MEYWHDLGIALSSSAVSVIVIGFAAKTTIEKWLDRKFKDTDEKRANEAMQFKAALDAFNARNDVQIRKLHDDRLTAIRELYPKCTEIHQKVGVILNMRAANASDDNPALEFEASKLAGGLTVNIKDLRNATNNYSPVFGGNEVALIYQFLHYAFVLAFSLHTVPFEDADKPSKNFVESFVAIQTAFKAIYGSDKF